MAPDLRLIGVGVKLNEGIVNSTPSFSKYRLTILFSTVTLAPAQAIAAASTGSLPWDGPLQTLAADLTGPVATSISVIALFVAGAVLVFGEDMGHFARRALVAVIAIAFLLLGSQFLIALGLTNG
jgi:type IV secretory pathway VirB2 component (pilin)